MNYTTTQFAFDATSHSYRIDGRAVPSVTEVVNDVMPGWRAGEWHMARGRAVHACAALVAQGKNFEYDKQIHGQITAIRGLFSEHAIEILAIERPVYSVGYRYAGTPDLVAVFDGEVSIVDYKATLDERVQWQMAGYAIAWESPLTPKIQRGIAVQPKEDGKYKMAVYDLGRTARARQEWLALLTVFNMRRKVGVTQQEEGEV